MRITYLLVLVLLFACSEGDETTPVVKECRLLKMVAETGQTVETSYTYNDKNQIVGQVRTRDGVIDFSYVISYKTDGMVDKVDIGTVIIEHVYTTGGKIQLETFVDKGTSLVTETRGYTWGTNKLQVVYKKSGEAKPYATMDYEFSGENVVHTVYKSFADFDANKYTFFEEVTYSNFDTGINQYFLAEHNRPGYSIASKNNYAKSVANSTTYVNGVEESSFTSTKTYVYTYNSSNATTSILTTTEDSGSSFLTVVTYEDCPE